MMTMIGMKRIGATDTPVLCEGELSGNDDRIVSPSFRHYSQWKTKREEAWILEWSVIKQEEYKRRPTHWLVPHNSGKADRGMRLFEGLRDERILTHSLTHTHWHTIFSCLLNKSTCWKVEERRKLTRGWSGLWAMNQFNFSVFFPTASSSAAFTVLSFTS